MNKYERLSKEVSYALRHSPWEYELELDSEGWVDVKKLIEAFKLFSNWDGLSIKDLEMMIDSSSKKRHEISNNKIRALYGHSLPKKIIKSEITPPQILYHGTTKANFSRIKLDGLLPMNRQYVHLSEDIDTAILVAKRKGKDLMILSIDTISAIDKGIKFYSGNEKNMVGRLYPV